eukprot:591872-Prorocentrum_minimum.AAC.1
MASDNMQQFMFSDLSFTEMAEEYRTLSTHNTHDKETIGPAQPTSHPNTGYRNRNTLVSCRFMMPTKSEWRALAAWRFCPGSPLNSRACSVGGGSRGGL